MGVYHIVRETTPLQGVSEQGYMPTPIGPPRTALPGEIQEIQEVQKDQEPPPLTPPNEETGLRQGADKSDTDPGQGADTHDLNDQLLASDQAQQKEEVEDKLERQLQAELLAPPSRETTSNVDASNILSRRRSRRARKDDDFAYATTIVQGIDEEPPALLHPFAAGLHTEKPGIRRHRDDLPPPPKY